MVRGLRPLVLLAGLLACTAAFAAEAVRDWLARMETAIESLSYEGTFVHRSDGRMETMHVVHRARDGEVAERLYSRDQPGREVIRSNDKVTCIFPDRRAVLVEWRKAGERSPLRAALPRYSEEVARWYEFRDLGWDRKLGREVKVVEIRPRDDARYGHRLWLDAETAMPMKVQLLDQDGEPVEEVQFVSIELPADIPDERLEPAVSVADFTWYERERPEAAADAAQPGPGWTAETVPSGFRLTTSRRQVLPGADHPVDHLVYSDGLASVSVFVEPSGAAGEGLDGLSRIGGANAWSTVRDGHQITAVGEVPPVTVRQIASSLRPVRRAPR